MKLIGKLVEIYYFAGKTELPKLTQKGTEILQRPITIKEI